MDVLVVGRGSSVDGLKGKAVRGEVISVEGDEAEVDGDDNDLIVTGCEPECFEFVAKIQLFLRSVLIVALQVLPRHRQVISPVFVK